jgi:hypothetical protein
MFESSGEGSFGPPGVSKAKEFQSGRLTLPQGRASAWPAPGPIGAGRLASSMGKRMRAPIMTRCGSCSRARWPRPFAAMVQHRPLSERLNVLRTLAPAAAVARA